MESNEVKEYVESNIVRITYKASGMPETVYREVEQFCNEYYGGCRWVMISDLVRNFKRSKELESRIKVLEEKLANTSKEETKKMKKTFG